MKKLFFEKIISFVAILLGMSLFGQAQTSTNTIKYKVTYDAPTQTYTAWVVPDYSVPNPLNTAAVEKGITAQFTVVVPKDFVITQLTDIVGIWTKPTEPSFTKFGPGNAGQTWTGIDPTLNYYVIGKTAVETDYGSFAQGTPVALFSFKGNGCYGPVKPLPAGDPFLAAADNTYSLNVGNSFYSRSGQASGGNVVPLEQFVNITGGVANCSISANPDVQTIKPTGPATFSILPNDKTGDGVTASLTNVTIPTVTTQPTKGTATVNPDGTIVYSPNPGATGTDAFVYQICDKDNPTVCDTARFNITLQPLEADLKISKTVIGSKSKALNDLATFTITVKNYGPDAATNVVIKDSVSAGLSLVSGTTNKGTFTAPLWTIPNIAAGDSATLTVTVKVIAEGVWLNYALVKSNSQADPDQADNMANACVSVPVSLCTGQSLSLEIPTQYTNVVWFKNGAQVATGNTYTATTSGSYTFTASNNTCPASGCCAYEVIVADCCPTNICIPFTVTKKKKK